MRLVSIGQTTHVTEALGKQGFDVIYCKDGIEGTRRIVSHQPDLALINIDTQLLGGIGIAKVLQLLQIPVPIIFTAVNTSLKDAAQSLRNFADFVSEDRMSDFLNADYFKEMAKIGKSLRERLSASSPCDLLPEEWTNLMAQPGRKRILIVEDDPISRKLLTMLLNKPDEVELYTAENGLEGIFKALVVRPDLILTDLMMPEVDGLTMSQIMYLLGKPYPIVFLTATAESEVVKKAARLKSVIGYLVKGDMSNKIVLMRTIEGYLKEAEGIAEASRKDYHNASMETLISTFSDQGGLTL